MIVFKYSSINNAITLTEFIGIKHKRTILARLVNDLQIFNVFKLKRGYEISTNNGLFECDEIEMDNYSTWR